jgi:rubrerythrin
MNTEHKLKWITKILQILSGDFSVLLKCESCGVVSNDPKDTKCPRCETILKIVIRTSSSL